MDLLPSLKRVRDVEAVVVPSDHVPPASKERPAEPPVEEGQRIVPEAAAASLAVVFEGEFGGSELRPRTRPTPRLVEQIEITGRAGAVLQPVVHLEIEESEGEVAHEHQLEQVVDTSICSIAVWRGYRKAMFYAQTFDADGETVALAESPTFKYHGNGIPDQTGPAAQAYEALVEILKREGWRTVEAGPAWFEQTLTRS